AWRGPACGPKRPATELLTGSGGPEQRADGPFTAPAQVVEQRAGRPEEAVQAPPAEQQRPQRVDRDAPAHRIDAPDQHARGEAKSDDQEGHAERELARGRRERNRAVAVKRGPAVADRR